MASTSIVPFTIPAVVPSESQLMLAMEMPTPLSSQRIRVEKCHGRTLVGSQCTHNAKFQPERARFAYCDKHRRKWARYEPVGVDQLSEPKPMPLQIESEAALPSQLDIANFENTHSQASGMDTKPMEASSSGTMSDTSASNKRLRGMLPARILQLLPPSSTTQPRVHLDTVVPATPLHTPLVEPPSSPGLMQVQHSQEPTPDDGERTPKRRITSSATMNESALKTRAGVSSVASAPSLWIINSPCRRRSSEKRKEEQAPLDQQPCLEALRSQQINAFDTESAAIHGETYVRASVVCYSRKSIRR